MQELDLGLPPRREISRRRTRERAIKSLTSLVADFHIAFGLPASNRPHAQVPHHLQELRMRLLQEEFDELRLAIDRADVVDIADALGDMTYVILGTAVTFGIDLDMVIAEIHRSNMSKLGTNGKPMMRPDGKVLKSENYRAPDLVGVLWHQPTLF